MSWLVSSRLFLAEAGFQVSTTSTMFVFGSSLQASTSAENLKGYISDWMSVHSIHPFSGLYLGGA